MRHSRFPIAVLLLVGLLAVPAQAQSQQNQSQQGTTVGLGLSLTQGFAGSEANTVSSSPLSISVPVTFSSFRIEPELGYSRSNQSSDLLESTRSTLLAGAGAFYVSRMDDFQLQIGARFGLRRTSMNIEGELRPTPLEGSEELPTDFPTEVNSSDAFVDYSLGPAIGGEYYVSDHLSLGVEARLLYTNRDSRSSSSLQVITLPNGNTTSSDASNSLINTEAAGYLRVHF